MSYEGAADGDLLSAQAALVDVVTMLLKPMLVEEVGRRPFVTAAPALKHVQLITVQGERLHAREHDVTQRAHRLKLLLLCGILKEAGGDWVARFGG